jgi:Tfp pilus assembly protein FimT
MSTENEQESPRQRSVLYIVVSVVLVILAVWAVIAFSSAREAQRAEEKADELVQVLEDAGATALRPEVIARVLGDDGGAVCANPNQALSRATLYGMLTTGAGGSGERPVIVDNKVLQGQLAIIEVYCPDELEEFQQFVDSLETTESSNG